MHAQWPQPRLGGPHRVVSSTASLKSSRGDEGEIARDASEMRQVLWTKPGCGTALHDNHYVFAQQLGSAKRDTAMF